MRCAADRPETRRLNPGTRGQSPNRPWHQVFGAKAAHEIGHRAGLTH